uniref:Uncharacterized protein n=2 Tax=Macaca TaxID=9539 RepID=A0A2K6AP05_MACNE|nr:unnamed protein product [Macaca fascicularis]
MGNTGRTCLYKIFINLARLGGTCLWSQLLRKLRWEDRLSPGAWWHMPVVPATGKVEVGGSLEPRRSRLQ